MKDFIIPAIDIKEGQVVRLFKGDFDKIKRYSRSPEEMAMIYADAGIRRIHVVDLDGSLEGVPVNLESIRNIRRVFNGIVQVGGGIRSLKTVDILFEEGIDYVVIGTLAIKNPEEFTKIVNIYPHRVILSVDSKKGRVAIGGWKEESSLTPQELASMYDKLPIWGYLYTDIERDGTLKGVRVDIYREFKEYTQKPVLASGGVASMEDVKALMCCADGVVVGKAIYEGLIDIFRL
ncbi:1-(5-phosphoribosyl)-5-[(5-phosphoribosylamino)methylideneamino]imidazole-4-carboxamide isomerase [Thermocrinis minervae]|uniref:1-(5-phosphoribosyl)-5-[(5-phosphoribosylamino)methylideneamino] imidazole-4-carboxamide isomerase n=1 Tax=Thermocrinis minervae TaxID=381751 RepID=A0A1M6TEM3_9AQUI|nr:1-(5-phosphoribosyl)-5-[(5-phosphoribosylamino)methylideneamino]imidazole-4-carboxamide isomerase [Thermocrinis minervae]SHK55324.1 1-(5-phosphoribosyl)-5-[(5-phosphoribosylamino)methylideneamino] imidazole-4-carboxamide isomerase [Thermocrinis minervae]